MLIKFKLKILFGGKIMNHKSVIYNPAKLEPTLNKIDKLQYREIRATLKS